MKYYYCKVICIFDIFIGNKLYICGGVCFVMGYMFYFMEVYDVVVGKFDRIVLDCFFFGWFLSLIVVLFCVEN